MLMIFMNSRWKKKKKFSQTFGKVFYLMLTGHEWGLMVTSGNEVRTPIRA